MAGYTKYVPYRDVSVGVPTWAQLSYMWRHIYSAVRIQRTVRRHLRRVRAAREIQNWWVHASYVFEL